MIVNFDASKMTKAVSNFIQYTDAFYKTAKMSERKIANKMGELSIDVFYEYMDGLARSHPGMLHHVYEWGKVGDPFSRLFELKAQLSGKKTEIVAEFLQSQSISDSSNVPFYNKAEVMEEGIPVIIQEVEAKALFFEIDGQEFFRTGPIVISNPGGSQTRGSFVKAFNDFYDNYFEDVYLRSIKFYENLRNPKEYVNQIRGISKASNPSAIGKSAAQSWVNKMGNK